MNTLYTAAPLLRDQKHNKLNIFFKLWKIRSKNECARLIGMNYSQNFPFPHRETVDTRTASSLKTSHSRKYYLMAGKYRLKSRNLLCSSNI